MPGQVAKQMRRARLSARLLPLPPGSFVLLLPPGSFALPASVACRCEALLSPYILEILPTGHQTKVSYVATTATTTATNQMEPGTLQMMLQMYGMGDPVPLPGFMDLTILILFKHHGCLKIWTHQINPCSMYFVSMLINLIYYDMCRAWCGHLFRCHQVPSLVAQCHGSVIEHVEANIIQSIDELYTQGPGCRTSYYQHSLTCLHPIHFYLPTCST